MLTLIAGSALAGERLVRTAVPVPVDRLFVVPDELTAVALTNEIFANQSTAASDCAKASLVSESTIISFDSLLNRLVSGQGETRGWVPPEIGLALVRTIMESDPEAFDYLVGSRSVPRLSHGVLERIASAMEAMQKAQQVEDGPQYTTARARQLQELARRFEERLTLTGHRLEKHGQMEAIAGLDRDRWTQIFPDVRHVVFLDFLDHSDVTYLAINAISRYAEGCDVLLEFDPEDENQAHSAMEAAYMRFYEMADKIVLSPEPKLGGQGDLFDEAPSEPEPTPRTEPRRPVVVTTDSLAQEVTSVTAAVRRMLDDADPGNPPSLVVAVTNWEEYAPALEKEFENFGIEAQWQESRSPLRSGEWLLLDRLRQCCGRSVSGSAVSALFRAPGFHCLLPRQFTSIEAWDLASRLDYVLTLTGKLQGWHAIIKDTGTMLDRIRKERQRKGLWTEEEGQHDTSLRELLTFCRDWLKPFSEPAPLQAWSQKVVAILNALPAPGNLAANGSEPLGRQVRSMMKHAALQVSRYAGLLGDEPVEFPAFLSIFRTVLYRARAENDAGLQSQPVTVCHPDTAARLRSDCCMVLGCNDGNFPRFAKPESSFVGPRLQQGQAGYRARQRAVFRRLLRNHRTTLLWMPARVGTEEALPSQFVEELLTHGRATKVKADELLETMAARPEGAAGKERAEFVESLRGLALSEAELKRFRLRSGPGYQIAHGISVLARRRDPQLGEYDGIITDPRLKAWLSHWASQHIYSVSQLDTVVGCSFRFFVDRILNLEEPEEADDLLPAHAFGSFAHDVLASFYRKWVADGRQVPRPHEELLARHELFKAYAHEYENLGDLSDFARDLLNLKLFGELGAEGFRDGHRALDEVRDVGVFGQFLRMEMQRGGDPGMDFLKPTGFEVGFGMGKISEDDPLSMPEHLELDLGGGERIKLRGRIDRIDLSPTGVFAVTDYKTGRVPTQKSITDCYRTQLPVYVMVGYRLLQGRYEAPDAAGGLYYSLRKGDNVKVSGVFFRAAYQHHSGVGGRCLKDEAFEETLENVKNVMRRSIRSVREGSLTTTWRDEKSVCPYCPFDGFCYRNVDRTREYLASMEIENDSET